MVTATTLIGIITTIGVTDIHTAIITGDYTPIIIRILITEGIMAIMATITEVWAAIFNRHQIIARVQTAILTCQMPAEQRLRADQVILPEIIL